MNINQEKVLDETGAIQDVVKMRKEAIRFFSNSCKQERDVWVVREFLRNFGRLGDFDSTKVPEEKSTIDLNINPPSKQ